MTGLWWCPSNHKQINGPTEIAKKHREGVQHAEVRSRGYMHTLFSH